MNKYENPNEMSNYLLFMGVLFGLVFLGHWLSQIFAEPDEPKNREVAKLENAIENNCVGHPNLSLCRTNLETFESHVRNQAFAFELELIDIGDMFHSEGYSRKQLRRNLDELYSLESPRITSKFNFKDMKSICLTKSEKSNSVPNYLHNLMGLNEAEVSEFLEGDGTNPFWRVKGHLYFAEESKEISLISSDSCMLPATIPELTMKSYSKLSLCEGYPYCLGVFWIEILLSEKEFFIEPSVEVKGFEFEAMSMEELLDLKIDSEVARKKAGFLKLQELKNIQVQTNK